MEKRKKNVRILDVDKRKKNVRIFDYDLLKSFFAPSSTVFGFIATVLGLLDINIILKMLFIVIIVVIDIILYIYYWYKSNHLKSIELKYAESSIEIKQGNIFADEYKNKNTIRVFAFNEYFDTLVNNKIISTQSLNGQFISKEVQDINTLDKEISEDTHLLKMKVGTNKNRIGGKTIKYKLGSIYKYNENVLLTALSHFDDENKAYLSVQDYIRFLINFWDEINNFYAGKTLVITLLGSGITRLDNNTYSSNQILEMILWTFYLRRIKFKKPAKLVILIEKSTNKNINYYMVRRMFNGLQE